MRFHRQYVALASSLIGEHIGINEIADDIWAVASMYICVAT